MSFYKKYRKYKMKYIEMKYKGGDPYSIESVLPDFLKTTTNSFIDNLYKLPSLISQPLNYILEKFPSFKKDEVINEFERNIITSNKINLTNLTNNLKFTIVNDYIYINGNIVKWVDIKKKYLFSETHDVLIMREFFDFRTKFVDNLIKSIFVFYGCNPDNKCISSPSGSVGPQANLGSDYDITINNQTLNVSNIIRSFNTIILKTFGNQPSVVFDTNLYGYSALLPKQILNNKKNINESWVIDTTFNEHYFLPLDIDKEQDKWALIRLITFLSPEYKSLIKLPDNIIPPKQNKSNEDMYVERMKIFEETFKNKEINRNEIANNLSFMNYYGDETYFTIGAFKHVVGTMFYYNKKSDMEKRLFLQNQEPNKNKSVNILKNNLIHSMIENLAYFIHVLHKNNDIIIAIKYLERFIDAFKLLKITNIKNYDKKLIDLMNILKNNFRNRSNEEILSYLKSENAKDLKEIIEPLEINIDNINNIKEKIINRLNDFMNTFYLGNKSKIYEIPSNLTIKNSIYIYYLIFLIKDVITKENTFITITFNGTFTFGM